MRELRILVAIVSEAVETLSTIEAGHLRGCGVLLLKHCDADTFVYFRNVEHDGLIDHCRCVSSLHLCTK